MRFRDAGERMSKRKIDGRAWAGGFLWCFVGWLLISFVYKFQVFGDLTAMGATSLGFTVPDAIIPGIVIWGIAKLFGV